MLSTAVIAACHLATSVPQEVLLDRVNRHAAVESHFNNLAIHDNATGQSYRPATLADAVGLVTLLVGAHHNVDAGIMQVNSTNWQRTGLTTPAKLFDEQANICAGVQIIAEDYDIAARIEQRERRVSCLYNTGKPECANGYPEKIAAAQPTQAPPIPAPTEPDTCAGIPEFDAWARAECQEDHK